MRDISQAQRPARRYGSDRSGGVTIAEIPGRPASEGHVWPHALNPMRSPCRVDRGKGLAQHRCSHAHATLVDGYRAWVRNEEAAAEAATHGYETELAEYWATHTRPTLKAYLLGMAQRHGE